MSVKNPVVIFEDARWGRGEQCAATRHSLALPFILSGPVLDVGGGDGAFASLLQSKYGFEVRVLDISPVGVKMATDRGISADIFDATEPLPFSAKKFGTVCALDVLEHLYDPLFVLREMGRVGTAVVIAVPNFHFILGRIHMLIGKIPFQSKPQRGHIYWFNYAVLVKMARDAHMRIDAVACGSILRLGAFGRFLARHFPALFADSFVVRLIPLNPI